MEDSTQLSEVGMRLEKIEKAHGLSARALCASIGNYNPSQYSKIKLGKRPLPRDVAMAIAEKYGVGLDWLLRGVERPIDGVRIVQPGEFMEVPYLSASARGGPLVSIGDPEYLETLPTMLLPKEYDKGERIVLDMTGHSMDDNTNRSICEGDKVQILKLEMGLYKPPHKLQINRFLFCVEARGDVPVVKQITEHDVAKGMIVCHSFNPAPEYEDYPVFLADVRSLWYVEKIVERRIRF